MATVKKEAVKKTPVKKTAAKPIAPSLRAVKRSHLEILEAQADKIPAAKKADGRKLKAESSLSAPIFDLTGKAAGSQVLPEEVFRMPVNKQLLSQAMRVYMNNQKGHFSNTKTRGEVRGSTRKIYKQKGTGGARHGAKRAPIFVGGGIALGPKFRKMTLKLPQKMKTAALVSALSQKMKEAGVAVASLEKASGKTKQMAKFTTAVRLSVSGSEARLKKDSSLLMVIDQPIDNAQRAVRNLPNVGMIRAADLSAFDALGNKTLVLTKEAIEKLKSRVLGEAR